MTQPGQPTSPQAAGSIELPAVAEHDERRRISNFVSIPSPAPHLSPRASSSAAPCRTVSRSPMRTCRLPTLVRRALLDLLSHNGFCFGALLPGAAISEAIRMQRFARTRPAPDQIATASPEGRALLQWITDDYRLTTDERSPGGVHLGACNSSVG